MTNKAAGDWFDRRAGIFRGRTGATHETTKVLFPGNLDARDRFAAWKIKPWVVVRLTFGFCK
jgi:hypothetical protein